MHDALFSEIDRSGIFADSFSFSERLDPDDGNRIVQEGAKETDGVRPTADASANPLRQSAIILRHELLARFLAHHPLEIMDHLGKRRRADGRANAIKGAILLFDISLEGGVHRFFEGLLTGFDRDDPRPED